LFFALIFAVL